MEKAGTPHSAERLLISLQGLVTSETLRKSKQKPHASSPPLLRGGGSAARRVGEVVPQNAADLALIFGESVLSAAAATSQSASLTVPLKRGAKGVPAPVLY